MILGPCEQHGGAPRGSAPPQGKEFAMWNLRELDAETEIINDPMEMDDLSNQPINNPDD